MHEGRVSLRERNRARTEAAIRNAAARLFAERGYAQTRTRDIAQAAGIATGTLFNYAPTKEDVVLLLWKARAAAAVEEGFGAASGCDDPIEALDLIFTPIFGFYAEDLDLGRVFLQTVAFRLDTDDVLRALNEGFVTRLAVPLVPHAGFGAIAAATNVFAAYYLVLTAMLAGRIDGAPAARQMLRELVKVQARGWAP